MRLEWCREHWPHLPPSLRTILSNPVPMVSRIHATRFGVPFLEDIDVLTEALPSRQRCMCEQLWSWKDRRGAHSSLHVRRQLEPHQLEEFYPAEDADVVLFFPQVHIVLLVQVREDLVKQLDQIEVGLLIERNLRQ